VVKKGCGESGGKHKGGAENKKSNMFKKIKIQRSSRRRRRRRMRRERLYPHMPMVSAPGLLEETMCGPNRKIECAKRHKLCSMFIRCLHHALCCSVCYSLIPEFLKIHF